MMLTKKNFVWMKTKKYFFLEWVFSTLEIYGLVHFYMWKVHDPIHRDLERAKMLRATVKVSEKMLLTSTLIICRDRFQTLYCAVILRSTTRCQIFTNSTQHFFFSEMPFKVISMYNSIYFLNFTLYFPKRNLTTLNAHHRANIITAPTTTNTTFVVNFHIAVYFFFTFCCFLLIGSHGERAEITCITWEPHLRSLVRFYTFSNQLFMCEKKQIFNLYWACFTRETLN